MGLFDYLTTESGEEITTESGSGILVQSESVNNDIQAFNFSVNLLQAILWQYNEATNLQSLLTSKNAWYVANQTQFWNNWLVDVYDLRTANQFGLIVWSIILGFPIYVNTPPYQGAPQIGFNGTGDVNFDNGNFIDQNGTTYILPLETQRIALQLRYFQLTGSGTVPEINRILSYVFGELGTSFLQDYGNMTQEYIFLFPLTADLRYLFTNTDILPRPAAVQSSFIDATIVCFGFNSFNVNFDNGGFGS